MGIAASAVVVHTVGLEENSVAGTLQKEDGGEKAIYYLTKKIRMFSNLINLIDLLPNHVNNVASYILVNGV
jgi:hypothetical protein